MMTLWILMIDWLHQDHPHTVRWSWPGKGLIRAWILPLTLQVLHNWRFALQDTMLQFKTIFLLNSTHHCSPRGTQSLLNQRWFWWMRTVAQWEDYIVCRSWMTALSSEMERTTGGTDEVSDACSAAPTYHLQNNSSHDHCGCHLTIKQVISWLLQMIGQSGQGSNTLICLPELPHPSGFLPLVLLQGRGPQRFTWHWISYCLCIFRGKKAMDEVLIFIWVHHKVF